jgi:3-hydroxybutyryl-CoA dehydrogenase
MTHTTDGDMRSGAMGSLPAPGTQRRTKPPLEVRREEVWSVRLSSRSFPKGAGGEELVMEIQTVGVAGLGLLGRGIAACLLGHGFEVVGFTRRRSTHDQARQHVAQAIDELIAEAGFPSALRDEWPKRYTAVDSLGALGPCDFVIESVIEDPAAKEEAFGELEAVLRPAVPIASNTSSIPVTRLQQGRKYPERFLGMHWAEPAHVTRFMELVRGDKTSDAALSAAADLATRLGKEPALVQKDLPAFIANRLGYALYREALNLVELGVADVQTIDSSCRNALGLWATLCGPFRWIDISGGPALYARAIQRVLPTLSNATELPDMMKRLLEDDARGIASGRGFYEYTEEEAARWEALYRKHAWSVRRLVDEYFPLSGPG